jgi:hypothetical protein
VPCSVTIAPPLADEVTEPLATAELLRKAVLVIHTGSTQQ